MLRLISKEFLFIKYMAACFLHMQVTLTLKTQALCLEIKIVHNSKA